MGWPSATSSADALDGELFLGAGGALFARQVELGHSALGDAAQQGVFAERAGKRVAHERNGRLAWAPVNCPSGIGAPRSEARWRGWSGLARRGSSASPRGSDLPSPSA